MGDGSASELFGNHFSDGQAEADSLSIDPPRALHCAE